LFIQIVFSLRIFSLFGEDGQNHVLTTK